MPIVRPEEFDTNFWCALEKAGSNSQGNESPGMPNDKPPELKLVKA